MKRHRSNLMNTTEGRKKSQGTKSTCYNSSEMEKVWRDWRTRRDTECLGQWNYLLWQCNDGAYISACICHSILNLYTKCIPDVNYIVIDNGKSRRFKQIFDSAAGCDSKERCACMESRFIHELNVFLLQFTMSHSGILISKYISGKVL